MSTFTPALIKHTHLPVNFDFIFFVTWWGTLDLIKNKKTIDLDIDVMKTGRRKRGIDRMTRKNDS